ncbi:hypothetical protein Tco_0244781, partial [Tanacetum coccineum]
MGEMGKLRMVTMEFVVVKSHSPYNVILGRTGLRSLGAVASTIHSMRKNTGGWKKRKDPFRKEESPIPGYKLLNQKTTIKGKEEILEQSNEKEETAKFGQSSPFHLDGEANRDKKERENDELPKASNESKPLEK